jgi:hypothetical protein
MNISKFKVAVGLGLAMTFGAAQAAGPLYLWEGGDELRPYLWDTSNGSIPVWTDGGGAFTWLDEEETEVLISIDRANEITQFAFDQWNNVPTSTFEANIAGTIESQIGTADIDGDNAGEVYGVENGYGFWVVYDTDGSILENEFGVPRSAVLGIAFPEWANEETGEITEATALINGWNVYATDTGGNMVAGVFTHEFGHAINMSHSQTNGQVAYFNYPWDPLYPGVPGCEIYPPMGSVEEIETMFPFIDHGSAAGEAQSTVNLPDDMAAISNLYPTGSYASTTGSISGVLRLKDGSTDYSGINVIARNVNDIYGDAVSAMTGDQTQGLVGPDGRYTIRNLTPGEEYVVYIEEIRAGGYPTTPMPLVSVAEYWNDAESSDPVLDNVCDATPILAVAGETATADITFNGYVKGIQYTPIVSAFLSDLSKNGKKSGGQAQSTAFVWDEVKGFVVLPESVKSNNGQMTRNGQKMMVQHDFSGNDIMQAAIFDFTGGKKGKLIPLGDLNDDSCGGESSIGVSSSYGWGIDDSGSTAVGSAYIDTDDDDSCQSSAKGEVVPFIWDAQKGMRMLPMDGVPSPTSWLRAQAISGNGKVVLGQNGGAALVAWVDEGPLIDLNSMYNGYDAYASSFDGTRVAIATFDNTVLLWNAMDPSAPVEDIGGLAWCVDMDYIQFGTNYCDILPHDVVQEILGPIAVLPFDMNDDGSVIVGRAGNFFQGFLGAIWIEDLGWMNLRDFFYKQGVTEAFNFPMNNPGSVSGSGSKMVGGLAGASFSWHVEMQHVYVCKDGASVQTGFPDGLRSAVADGAEFGRCEFID